MPQEPPAGDAAAAGAGASLVRGSSSLFVGRVVASALSYGGTAVVARALGPERFGGLTFVLAVTSLVADLLDLQVGRLVIRELDDAPDAEAEAHVLGSFTTFRALTGFLAGLICVAYTLLTGQPDDVVVAACLAVLLTTAASAWNGLLVWFQVRHRFGPVAAALIASRLVYVAFVVVLVVGGIRAVAAFMVPAVVIELVVLAVLVAKVRPELPLRVHVSLPSWRRWFVEAVPIALGAAVGVLYNRIDVVMVTSIDGLQAAGHYGIAYKFTDLIGYVPGVVMAAVFPLLVRAWPDRPARFAAVIADAAVLLAFVAAGVLGAIVVFVDDVIGLLYGDDYRVAATAAAFVVGGEAARFLTAMSIKVLIAVRRNRAYPIISIAGLLVNVGLNLVLIPRWSFEGAAVATVITEVLVLVLVGALVLRLPDVRLPAGPFARVALAFAVEVVVGLLLAPIVPWPLALLAAVAAYLAVLQVIGLRGPGGLRVVPDLIRADA